VPTIRLATARRKYTKLTLCVRILAEVDISGQVLKATKVDV